MDPFIALFGVSTVAVLALVVVMLVMFRRVVPTNMVHIVQRTKSTTAYGRGKSDGNTYYAWPSRQPHLNVA